MNGRKIKREKEFYEENEKKENQIKRDSKEGNHER